MRFICAAGFKRPAGNVVAENDGGNEFPARHLAPGEFGSGHCRRNDDGARMVAPARVVKFKGVRSRAVDERRVQRGNRFAGAPERGSSLAFACFAKRFEKKLGFGRNRARNARSDAVEDVPYGFFGNGAGKVVIGRIDDEARELRAFGFSDFCHGSGLGEEIFCDVNGTTDVIGCS